MPISYPPLIILVSGGCGDNLLPSSLLKFLFKADGPESQGYALCVLASPADEYPQEAIVRMRMVTRHQALTQWLAVAMLGVALMFGAGHEMGLAQETLAGGSTTQTFSAVVTTRPLNLDILSLYIDSPLRQVVMDGGVWVFGALPDPYHNPITVPRWKGPDFEHMVRQPDGAADFPQRSASSFIDSGLWYDKSTGTLYALMHGEYGHAWPGDAWCRKKIWLVTSRDLGMHWTFVGDVLTAVMPSPIDRMKYSGSEYEMGPADYDLYVDTRGGYFYVTSWNGFVAKNGALNHFTAGTVEVARCALRDKMGPGKWFKFNNGTWTQPGLGGKASRVGMTTYGIYGNTIYSTYLQKYLRIGVNAGTGDPRFPNVGMRDGSIYVSTCTDLSKQDWTPMAKLVDQPDNGLSGFTLAAGDGVDPSVCGQTLRVYNYWVKSGRILDIALNKGTMDAAPFPPHGSYSYEPHPESGDRIESRRTKIVGAASPEMRYSGSGWSFENNPLYYRGQINKSSTAGDSVEFSFRGADIYWRAIAAQDGGRADVYIDNQLQTTVDLYFWDTPQIFQFAFIKTGLDPLATHTIMTVARGDKNASSRGTYVNHMAFEYSAESYWALAGFSSVLGKNNWRYQSAQGSTYNDLYFNAASNCWLKEGQCLVGNSYQTPLGSNDAVKKWVAPHDGDVRIEGTPATDASNTGGFVVSVRRNAKEVWSARLASPETRISSLDTTVAVRAGDAIAFDVHKLEPARNAEREVPGALVNNAAARGDTTQRAPLKIGVKEISCGMVCHAVSKTVVRLPGPGKTFSAIIGADASGEPDAKGSAVFSVLVGGKVVFKSGVMKRSKKGVPVDVDLAGAKEFVLEVSDGGDEIAFDWANWADAKTILTDGKAIWLADLHLNQWSSSQPRVLWDPVITYLGSPATGK